VAISVDETVIGQLLQTSGDHRNLIGGNNPFEQAIALLPKSPILLHFRHYAKFYLAPMVMLSTPFTRMQVHAKVKHQVTFSLRHRIDPGVS